ncbi:MAG: TGS domain-containing protein, partial [Cyclobacteriaceae bacterium]
MSDIKITLPDGSIRNYPAGTTGLAIAQSISEGLARVALSIEVNGEIRDLNRPILSDSSIRIFTWNDKGGKYAFWHSSAHLFAEALEALYPGVKFGIGPPIDNGFYYDVDLGDKTFGEDDLAKVEAKMSELAKKNSVFVRRDVPKAEAIAYFEK